MTDVFRSEILAVVMQQIMDEPVLPVLFLRTVSSDLSQNFLVSFIDYAGYTGCNDIQIISRLRLHNPPLSTNNEKDLDKDVTPIQPDLHSVVVVSPNGRRRNAMDRKTRSVLGIIIPLLSMRSSLTTLVWRSLSHSSLESLLDETIRTLYHSLL